MSEVTGVEGKKNVQDTASADDKRDMFMQIIQMTFTSHEAAYDFYNSYARDNGFSIRKNRVRQGKRDNRLLTEEGHSRRLRPETRCHCEAHLTVKLDQKRGVWREIYNLCAREKRKLLSKGDAATVIGIMLQESLKTVIAKSHEYDQLKENLSKKMADLSTCAIEYVDDGEGNIVEVHDPIKVSTKGATKEEVKCNYVEWVDPEWSVATKFCLRELWSMYDEKLRQNIKNAEENCMLIGEKRRTEEDLRFFKMDFAKLVADKEDALTQLGNARLSLSDLKEELEKNKMVDHGCANLHQVLRVKAEKDRDRVVLERPSDEREGPAEAREEKT
nr:uncharacterized protein LOC120971712 [Aegilops tauschii subsp. strangulata]